LIAESLAIALREPREEVVRALYNQAVRVLHGRGVKAAVSRVADALVEHRWLSGSAVAQIVGPEVLEATDP
jgi:hypothetical protein